VFAPCANAKRRQTTLIKPKLESKAENRKNAALKRIYLNIFKSETGRAAPFLIYFLLTVENSTSHFELTVYF